jgi:SAM-dependent methyltransferase
VAEHDRPPSPGGAAPRAAYGAAAGDYEDRTRGFARYRHRAVGRLPLEPGDAVLDVGCGTGLCLELLVEQVGPRGTVVGVDPSPQMLALAERRVTAHGWGNVRLVRAPAETAQLPVVDHVLFCAVHDVLQSPAALDNVLGHVRAGGGVAATGGKWAPAWAVPVNAVVLAVHAPFVHSFAGFDRPCALLAERVPDLREEEIAFGGGYLAWGRTPRGT